jgi:benzoyl-CoA reductase/2-hydroxyglutaryl-CoA dehydratase subunit BcrC/BadD/HgdB
LKDLKHMIWFEHLLDDAANELVLRETAAGKHAIGYTCYHMPEVLLNLDNCFSVRLRAPRTGSLDISTYYMTNYLCGYSKALVERGIEGGYGFLSALAGTETCSEMNRALEHFELLQLVKNPDFFVSFVDVPFKVTEHGLKMYCSQLREKVLEPLHGKFGTDVSEKAMLASVERHNELCRVLTEIGDFRRLDNPPITGYEYHILCLVSYCCPQELVIGPLKETLEEIKKRRPDIKPAYRVRIEVVGSEVDDPEFTRTVEESGALIVADRFCFGSVPGRQEISLPENMPVLEGIVQNYMQTSQCPRYMPREKVEERRDTVERLAREYRADGILYEAMKFCEYWGYERPLASRVLSDERGIPTVCIDRQYTGAASGQLRTRVQAFVESLEIKQIGKNREGR